MVVQLHLLLNSEHIKSFSHLLGYFFSNLQRLWLDHYSGSEVKGHGFGQDGLGALRAETQCLYVVCQVWQVNCKEPAYSQLTCKHLFLRSQFGACHAWVSKIAARIPYQLGLPYQLGCKSKRPHYAWDNHPVFWTVDWTGLHSSCAYCWSV